LPPAVRPIQVGDLVGLVDGKGPQLAVVQALRGSRAELIVGLQGRPQQTPLRLLEQISASPGQDPARQLGHSPWNLDGHRLQVALPSRRELAAAWLLLSGDSSDAPLDLGSLVDLVGDAADPAQRAACWLWLQGPQTYFRWRHQQLQARNLTELRQLRRERRQQALGLQRQQQWQAALQQRRPLQVDQLDPSRLDDLALLRRWAAGDAEQPLPLELRRGLQAAHCAPEAGAIRHLLADLGQWPRHHLPSLEATTWQHGFSADLLAEADRLLASVDAPHPGDEHRLDLTDLHTVTIDDDDTLDIDDGLSLQTGPAGRPRLWIHVADPGRSLISGSPLDLEARRRGSSLYLARGTLPMFPAQLANGPFSLLSGRRCPAWSLWVDLDDHGAVEAYGLQRTWIRPAYRLSYGDADELIELAPPQERQLLDLHSLLQRRRRWRQQQGALCLDQSEGRIRCRGDEPERSELEITEPSPSRLMVAEAMILAGAVIGAHGRSSGLALPFRSQQASELPTAAELDALPAGPVRHAAIKRCLNRGHMGVSAAAHFSLGLDAYVQATSPIRRYGDLLVQRQLAAQLEGRTPLDADALGLLLSEIEAPTRQGLQISREDQRHWQQVWFEQNAQPEWQGLFLRWLRPQDQLGLVHLEDLALELPCHCPPRSEPADRLLVRVREVDSLRDQLRLEASA
jgi:exoribonuclease-2